MSFIDEMRDYSKQSSTLKPSKLTDSITQDMTCVVIDTIKQNLKQEIGHKHVISSKGLIKKYYYEDKLILVFSLRDDYSYNRAYDYTSISISVITKDDIVHVMSSIINCMSEFSSYTIEGHYDNCAGYKPPIIITFSNCLQAVNTIMQYNVKKRGPSVCPSILFDINARIACCKDGSVI